jgi:hypothetical protein
MEPERFVVVDCSKDLESVQAAITAVSTTLFVNN